MSISRSVSIEGRLLIALNEASPEGKQTWLEVAELAELAGVSASRRELQGLAHILASQKYVITHYDRELISLSIEPRGAAEAARLREIASDEMPTPQPAVQISNTFSPVNTFAPTNTQSHNGGMSEPLDAKSSTRASWLNVWMALAALIVAIISVLVTLKIAGKI